MALGSSSSRRPCRFREATAKALRASAEASTRAYPEGASVSHPEKNLCACLLSDSSIDAKTMSSTMTFWRWLNPSTRYPVSRSLRPSLWLNSVIMALVTLNLCEGDRFSVW